MNRRRCLPEAPGGADSDRVTISASGPSSGLNQLLQQMTSQVASATSTTSTSTVLDELDAAQLQDLGLSSSSGGSAQTRTPGSSAAGTTGLGYVVDTQA